MPEVVALGEPLLEFVAAERGRLRDVKIFQRGWGGDTSNFVVAVARLGGSSGYLTRIGGDEFGRSFLALWRQEGVDTSQVIVEPDGVTGIYFIAFPEDGVHEFTYYRAGSAASYLQPTDIPGDYVARARVFHTSGITQAISASAAETAQVAIIQARARNLIISYDANIRPKLRSLSSLRAVFEAIIPSVDIVFLSGEDAGHLYGTLPPHEVVHRILAHGPSSVILKQGAAGCLIAAADGTLSIPGWPVTPVDATGAGDAFDAAFLVEWLRGVPLDQAGRFANAVGALTASSLGAVSAIPTRTRVEQYMAQFESSRLERMG